MAKVLIDNYTFVAADRKVTLTDYASVDVERILLVVNITLGETWYVFNDNGCRASVVGNVITFDVSIDGAEDTDKLMIFYDDPDYFTPVSGTVTAELSATDNAVFDDIAANQTDASQKTQVVDGSGNVIGSTSNALDVNIKSGASSGEQYADGTIVNAAYKGTIALGTDGSNYQAVSVDATGNINVNIVSGAGSGGTASDDDADFTAGDTAGTPAMGVYESSPTSVTDGDMGIVGITAGRRLKTSATIDAALPAGTNGIGKLTANSGVDIGDVDVLSIAAGDNNIGNVDIVTVPAPLSTTGGGTEATALRVTVANDSTGRIIANGNVAHDAVDSGNPIKIGGKGVTVIPTIVNANDRVDGFFDQSGRLITAHKALTGSVNTISASASNVTILAANTARLGATIYNDSTAILYLKCGATASATSFTVKMQADDFYEVPYGYVGIIDGIWASATGDARTTEFT